MREEIEEVLKLAELLACMSVLGIADLTKNEALALKVHGKFLGAETK